MPFTFKVEGMDKLLSSFGKLQQTAQKVAAEALYEGAGVMADAVSRSVQGIETKRMKYPAPPDKQRMPSPEEKEILLNARHGVAKFRNNGNEINTSIGFQNSGYAVLKGRIVPVPVIANSINSGTSFMKKQPFMRKAFSQNKAKAIAAIENGIKAREDEFNID